MDKVSDAIMKGDAAGAAKAYLESKYVGHDIEATVDHDMRIWAEEKEQLLKTHSGWFVAYQDGKRVALEPDVDKLVAAVDKALGEHRRPVRIHEIIEQPVIHRGPSPRYAHMGEEPILRQSLIEYANEVYEAYCETERMQDNSSDEFTRAVYLRLRDVRGVHWKRLASILGIVAVMPYKIVELVTGDDDDFTISPVDESDILTALHKGDLNCQDFGDSMVEETTVINIKDAKDWRENGAVYIGRANPRRGLKESPFHNPFKGKPRLQLIELFQGYFLERVGVDSEFRRQVLELQGKVLVCYCHPLPCHGDIIAAFLEGWGEAEAMSGIKCHHENC